MALHHNIISEYHFSATNEQLTHSIIAPQPIKLISGFPLAKGTSTSCGKIFPTEDLAFQKHYSKLHVGSIIAT